MSSTKPIVGLKGMFMNSLRMTALLAASLLGATACSQSPAPPSDPLPVQGSAPAPVAVEPAKQSVGSGTTELADFTVDPGQVFNCEGRDRATSTVKWLVKDPAVVTVKIQVGDGTSDDKQTFAAGANIGEAITGNWVGGSTHFFLVDGETGRELANYQVAVLPCN